jgi:hypothetical protein
MHVPISMRDILGGAHDENRSGDKGIQSRSTSLFQIERVEALGEPAADWSEKIAGLSRLP